MDNIFPNVSKTAIAIVCGGGGVILGMIVSAFFLKFTVPVTQIENDLKSSCAGSEADKMDVYLFGTQIKVECKDGKVNTFRIKTSSERE